MLLPVRPFLAFFFFFVSVAAVVVMVVVVAAVAEAIVGVVVIVVVVVAIIPCVPNRDSRRRNGVMADDSMNMDGKSMNRRILLATICPPPLPFFLRCRIPTTPC